MGIATGFIGPILSEIDKTRSGYYVQVGKGRGYAHSAAATMAQSDVSLVQASAEQASKAAFGEKMKTQYMALGLLVFLGIGAAIAWGAK